MKTSKKWARKLNRYTQSNVNLVTVTVPSSAVTISEDKEQDTACRYNLTVSPRGDVSSLTGRLEDVVLFLQETFTQDDREVRKYLVACRPAT
jgi:hypothetical protein